jgi:hypothetical protein
VHLANNAFKVFLVARSADTGVLLRFGVPTAMFASLGAALLGWLADLQPLHRYSAFGRGFEVVPLKSVVAAINGFFGGQSGHQGAFRGVRQPARSAVGTRSCRVSRPLAARVTHPASSSTRLHLRWPRPAPPCSCRHRAGPALSPPSPRRP